MGILNIEYSIMNIEVNATSTLVIQYSILQKRPALERAGHC
jgi:hypothetical protein